MSLRVWNPAARASSRVVQARPTRFSSAMTLEVVESCLRADITRKEQLDLALTGSWDSGVEGNSLFEITAPPIISGVNVWVKVDNQVGVSD